MGGWQLGLDIARQQALEIHGLHIEITTRTLASQIGFGLAFSEEEHVVQRAIHAKILHEIAVSEVSAVPAGFPAIIEIELADALYHAPKCAIAGAIWGR